MKNEKSRIAQKIQETSQCEGLTVGDHRHDDVVMTYSAALCCLQRGGGHVTLQINQKQQ